MKQNDYFFVASNYTSYDDNLNVDDNGILSNDKSYFNINLAKFIDYRHRLSVCLLATFFLVLLSPYVFNQLGFSINIITKLDSFIESLLFSVIYFYGGLPFYKKAIAIFRFDALLFIQLINILDASLYLFGIVDIFDFYDNPVTLNIVTFIDGMLIVSLLRKKILLLFINYNNF